MKSKFGQNLSEKVRLQLIDRLLERNYDSDRETVAEMYRISGGK